MAWLQQHTGDVLAVVCSLKDDLIVTAGHDKAILVWDYKLRTIRQRLTDKTAAPSCPSAASVESHAHLVSSLCVLEAEGLLISGSWDCSVKVWNLADGRLRHTLQSHSRINTVVKASWGGRNVVVSGGADGSVCVWDFSRGVALRNIKETHAPHSVTALASLEGRAGDCLLASTDSNKNLKLWALGAGDREEGQKVGKRADVVVLDDPCSCLCVLAAQSLAPRIACGLVSGRVLLFCAIAEPRLELQLLLSLDAHAQKVTSLCASQGSPPSSSSAASYFFSTSKDGLVKSWSLEQLERDQGAGGAGMSVNLRGVGRPGLEVFGCCSLPSEQRSAATTDEWDLSHEDLAVVTSDGCLAILAISTVAGRQQCISGEEAQGELSVPEETQQEKGIKITVKKTTRLPDIDKKGKRPPALARPSNNAWRLEDATAADLGEGGEVLLTPLLAPLSPESVSRTAVSSKARRTARPIIRAQTSSSSPLILASPESTVIEEIAHAAILLQAELTRTKGTRSSVLGSLMRNAARP